jgi:hypothetical protein
MDQNKLDFFVSQYQGLDEYGLLEVDKKRATLAEEAVVALDKVLAARQVDLASLRAAEAAEEAEAERAEVARQQKVEARDAKYFKYFLIVAAPLVLLGLVFNTGAAYEALVATVVQVGLLGFAYWGYLKYKKARSRK